MFLTRFTFALVLIFTAFCCSHAADDPIAPKLSKAKEDYHQETEKLRVALLQGLDKAEDDARAAGNKPLVDKLKAERVTFIETGKLPSISAAGSYDRSLEAARSKLETAYKSAMTEYLKAKKDDQLAVVEQEMKEFLATKPGMKPALKDAYPVGTILAGQLRWNGDPGNHNYMIVITERNGKKFRGIARSDYGPSGDAKRKGFYDIEGEVTATGLKFKGELSGLGEVEGKWLKDALQITARADNGGILSGGLRFIKK
jgi:hypothetical protein